MADKTKHMNRSKRSSHDYKEGMRAMNWNSNLKTQQRRRIKELVGNKEE